MNDLPALIETLRESAHTCPQCAKHAFEVIEARNYYKKVAHSAAYDRRDRDWTDKLAHERDELAERVRRAEEHLDEPHEEPEQHPAKTPRVRRAKADDGKVTCPTCGGRATPRGENQIGAHHSPWGRSCRRRLLKVSIDELPPVNIRKRGRPSPKRSEGTPARLDVGSNCRECGKWLPGERSICGACYVRSESTRKKKP